MCSTFAPPIHQPVGAGSSSPDRIMCTELEAEWTYADNSSARPKYSELNPAIMQQLIGKCARVDRPNYYLLRDLCSASVWHGTLTAPLFTSQEPSGTA